MQRKFFTNLILLLFLNLLIKPVWIGIDLVVQNKVGTAVYGNYYALLSFTFVLNILLDLGVANFNKVNIAQHPYMLKKHFSGIISLRVLLGVLFGAVMMGTGLLSGYSGNELYLLGILVFNQFLIALVLYLRSNLAGLLMFKSEAIVSVMDRFLMIGFCAALLWGGITQQPFKIEWFVYVQTLGYGLTALLAFILVWMQTREFKLRFNWAFSLLILKKSFPFALLILLMSFYNRIDAVLIERLLPNGNEQAGLYAQGYRLLDAVNMIAFLFAGLLLPIFARMIKRKENVEQLTSLSFRILFAGAVPLAIISAFFSSEILQLLYHEQFTNGPLIFSILMACFIPISSMYVFGTLLTANQSLKTLNIIAAGGMLINVCMNLILIPRYEALGAATTSLITQGLTVILQMVVVVRLFKFRMNYMLLARLVIYVLATGATVWGIRQLEMRWELQALASIAIIGLLALVLRIVSLAAALKIMRLNE